MFGILNLNSIRLIFIKLFISVFSFSQGSIIVNGKSYKTKKINSDYYMIENFVINNPLQIVNDISKDPCPGGWRMPTQSDYKELYNLTYVINGKDYYEKCYRCGGSTEIPKTVDDPCKRCAGWNSVQRNKKKTSR